MKLSDFDFDLPEALIAVRPMRPRGAARLLVVDAALREITARFAARRCTAAHTAS